MNKLFFALLLLLPLFSAQAVEEQYPFDNDGDRERFQRFTHEMRCPLCQSQTLAGSDASVSQDLKRELHRLITEGKTDAEIIDFMTSRYGDFILYKPRAQGTNLILWLSPLALLLFGLGAFVTVVIKKQPPADDEE